MTERIHEILTSGRAEGFSINIWPQGWRADLDGVEGPYANTIDIACDWCADLFDQMERETVAEAAELERKRIGYRREIGL